MAAVGDLEYELIPQPDGTSTMHPNTHPFMDGERLEGAPWPDKVGGPLRSVFEDLPLEKLLVWDYLHVVSCYTPVVSPKLRRVLEEVAGADVQFFPMTIIGKDGQAHEGYSVLNVCAMVQAIDEKRSVLRERLPPLPGEEEDPDYHPGYYRIAFVAGDPLQGHHIARQADPEIATIWGSETLKQAVEAAGCRGVAFEDPNDILARQYDLEKIFGEKYGTGHA